MPDDLPGKVGEILDGTSKNKIAQEDIDAEIAYKKIKGMNDKLEGELKRSEELRQKQMLGGKSLVQPEKTKRELAEEKAAEIRKIYGR